MAYCSNCGYSNPEAAKFCNECGQKLYKADVEIQSVPAMSNLVGKTCPYCQTPFKEGADVVLCDACGMPHHKECWVANNNSCTTFGCKSVKDVLPDTEQQAETNPFFAAQANASSDNTARQKRKYLLPIALAVAVIAVGFAALNMTNKPSVNTTNKPSINTSGGVVTVDVPKKLSSNIPAGAGGYKWGEDIRNIPGLKVLDGYSNVYSGINNMPRDSFKEYLPPEVEKPKKGSMWSYKYKYIVALIGIDGPHNSEKTRQFLENKYGPPQGRVRHPHNREIIQWMWMNKDTKIVLTRGGSLLISRNKFDAYTKGELIQVDL